MSDHNSTLHDLQGAQDGDPLSWDRLDARLRPWLLRQLASERMPPGCTTDDVVNAALGEVFRDITRFEPVAGSTFRKWVLTVTLNQLQDLWRREGAIKRRAPGGLHSLDAGTGEDSQAPLQVADPTVTRASMLARCHEIESALRGAMTKFDESTRRVLEMRLFNDLPFEDIAKDPLVKWNKVETIRVVFFRAKEKLQAQMRQFAPIE